MPPTNPWLYGTRDSRFVIRAHCRPPLRDLKSKIEKSKFGNPLRLLTGSRRRDMMRPSGEVSEWPKEQHWKCCNGLKPVRGFESRPLRLMKSMVSFTNNTRAP